MPPFFASLPESIWVEVNRRIRLEPALRDLLDQCEDETRTLLAAKCQTTEAWRPGNIGEVYLAICRQRSSANSQLPELASATNSAVNLAERLLATKHIVSLAIDSKDHLREWSLPLVCVYPLLADPQLLVTSLLDHNLINLAARVLLVNETPQTLIASLPSFIAAYPVSTKLALANYFSAHDAPQIASLLTAQPKTKHSKGISRLQLPSDPQAAFRALADHLDQVFLTEHSTQPQTLTSAIESALSLATDLTLRLGHRALKQNDPVSALAAFREAQKMRPQDLSLRAFSAEALALMNNTDQALIELGSQQTSNAEISNRALLATARVQFKANNVVQANDLLKKILKSNESDRDILESCAALLTQLGDAASAAQAWEKLLALNCANAPLHLNLAQYNFAQGNFDQAQQHAWHTLGFDPNQPQAWKILAKSIRKSEPKSALAHYQRALAHDPDPLSQLEYAETALAAGQPETALATAEHLIAIKSDAINDGSAHIIAGKALTQLGKQTEAFEYFNRATDLAPNSSLAWRSVAAHHREHHDLTRAQSALQAASRYINNDADLFSDLGEIYVLLEKRLEAIDVFKKVISIDSTRGVIHKYLGELYRAQNRFAESIDSFQQSLVYISLPERSTIETKLGNTLEAFGKLEDALAAYQRAHSSAVGVAPVELLRDLGRLAYQLGRIHIARPALELSLQSRTDFNEDDLSSFTLLGSIYEQLGDFDIAFNSYKQAIALAPLRADLIVRLGVCCLELGKPEAAIAALQDAVEHDPTNITLHKILGQAYAAAHLWNEATTIYEAASRLEPGDHQLLRQLAQCANKAGNTVQAVNVLQQAIALAPDSADYRQELAEVLVSNNHLPEARSLYLEALNLSPTAISILTGLGNLYLKLKEYAEAANIFEQATQIDSTRVELFKALGDARSLLGHFEQAQAAFVRAAAIEPLNPEHLRRAGECLWQLARHAAAIATWQKNLVAHPNDSQTHAKLGAALSYQGKHAEALDSYEQAAKGAPGDPSLAIDTARIAFSLNKIDQALPHLERVVKLTPNDSEAWQMLGQTYRAKNAIDLALNALQRASQAAPHLGKPHAALARLLSEINNIPEALKAISDALAIDPESFDVISTACDVFIKANRLTQAITAAQKMTRIYPDEPQTHLALAKSLILNLESNGNSKSIDVSADTIFQELDRAAALGADSKTLREWRGRALAIAGDPAEAIPLISNIQSPDALRALAICNRRLGKMSLAKKSIDEALTRAPDSIQNLLELARIHIEHSDAANARATLERLIALQPQHAVAHQLLAETLWSLNKRLEALAEYREALILEPTQTEWHYRFGELLELKRDTPSAIRCYQHAIDLAIQQSLPETQTANYVAALARAYSRINDLVNARDQFDRALKLNSEIPLWWTQCGNINLQLNQYERAWECFTHAHDLPALMGAAHAALALNRNEDAQEKILDALRFNSDNPEALMLLAEVYVRRADYDNALTAYGIAANFANDPRPALMAHATLLLDMNDALKAIGSITRILKLDAEDDEALGLLSDALAQSGRLDEATEACQHATRLAPEKASHWLRFGKLWNASGQLDVALTHLQKAHELEPSNTEVVREMALVYQNRHQGHRALELYEQLIQIQPDVAEHFYQAGLAAKALRDYQKALKLFKQATEIDPTNPEYQKQRLSVSASGVLKN